MVLSLLGALLSSQLPDSIAADENVAEPLPLQPVFRLKPVDGKQEFVASNQIGAELLAARAEGVAFLAVSTNSWPPGLVPVFAIERTNRIELRRRPLRGNEGSTEPVFFALPPIDEPDAAKIAGRWECTATREGSKPYFGWDLTLVTNEIVGRMDQSTDYRVAFLTGGTFASNHIELHIEYVQDKFVLNGDWKDGRMQGKWRRTDDAEQGTWEATRGAVTLPSDTNSIALYEWRRAADEARRYALEDEPLGSEWERAPRPLCRVWRAPRNLRQ